ncbi:hmg box protein [Ceratocystis lukuohia]|uniref:HMG box domain-containing protein n=3 Tax=Ceratocystis TaxID=5157 RepID=A0A0F8DF16_CERFI|nr:hypothetical protein CFO_g3083 [Ceratocystis platani]PHH50472.1 hypothetical protein CFIMG_005746RA [Ceratocystis fimbriata CBS 114723]
MAPRTKKASVGAALTESSASGNGAIPHPLPPSVEEAYRRKCRYLRHRTNEIEEVNDSGRLRLARLKRQVEKLRLERAFLLEQMAKRTSTNVEDSDGSPSPPPTPKEKPLRLKRGHRKPSIADDGPGAAVNGTAPASPTADNKTNGTKPDAETDADLGSIPANAFEVYCSSMRQNLTADNIDKPDFNIEDELERGWKDLPHELREDYQEKYELLLKEAEKNQGQKKHKAAGSGTSVAARGKQGKPASINGKAIEGDKEKEGANADPEADEDTKKPDIKADADVDDIDADTESKSEAKVSEGEAEAEVDVAEDEDEDVEMADGPDTRPASPKND